MLAALKLGHDEIEGTVGDCPEELLHERSPGATIGSIASIYAHAIFSEDGIVNAMIRGGAPLYVSQGWQSKLGVPMPPGGMQNPDWAIGVEIKDLPTFRQYAQAVYAATEDFVNSVPDAELERKLNTPVGEQTVGWMLEAIVTTHVPQHCGEIAALKGIHGLKGLPF